MGNICLDLFSKLILIYFRPFISALCSLSIRLYLRASATFLLLCSNLTFCPSEGWLCFCAIHTLLLMSRLGMLFSTLRCWARTMLCSLLAIVNWGRARTQRRPSWASQEAVATTTKTTRTAWVEKDYGPNSKSLVWEYRNYKVMGSLIKNKITIPSSTPNRTLPSVHLASYLRSPVRTRLKL